MRDHCHAIELSFAGSQNRKIAKSSGQNSIRLFNILFLPNYIYTHYNPENQFTGSCLCQEPLSPLISLCLNLHSSGSKRTQKNILLILRVHSEHRWPLLLFPFAYLSLVQTIQLV